MTREQQTKDEQMVRDLVEGTYMLLQSKKITNDPQNMEKELLFLYCYLETLLGKVLTAPLPEPKKKNSKRNGDFAVENFRVAKEAIQEAIALAFQSAMIQMCHQEIEYLCRIQAIRESGTNLLC